MLHSCLQCQSNRIRLSVLALAMMFAAPTVPAKAAGDCPLGQFLAEYYDTSNPNDTLVFTSCESAIDHDWGTRAASKGADSDEKADADSSLSVGPNNFRVHWTGRFSFQDGVYTFIAVADDGIRVNVDGQMIVNEWRVQPKTEFRRQRPMTAGTHSVDVEYFQAAGAAVAKLRWQRGS
jgi:hypothetical protein